LQKRKKEVGECIRCFDFIFSRMKEEGEAKKQNKTTFRLLTKSGVLGVGTSAVFSG